MTICNAINEGAVDVSMGEQQQHMPHHQSCNNLNHSTILLYLAIPPCHQQASTMDKCQHICPLHHLPLAIYTMAKLTSSQPLINPSCGMTCRSCYPTQRNSSKNQNLYKIKNTVGCMVIISFYLYEIKTSFFHYFFYNCRL